MHARAQGEREEPRPPRLVNGTCRSPRHFTSPWERAPSAAAGHRARHSEDRRCPPSVGRSCRRPDSDRARLAVRRSSEQRPVFRAFGKETRLGARALRRGRAAPAPFSGRRFRHPAEHRHRRRVRPRQGAPRSRRGSCGFDQAHAEARASRLRGGATTAPPPLHRSYESAEQRRSPTWNDAHPVTVDHPDAAGAAPTKKSTQQTILFDGARPNFEPSVYK